MKYILEKDKLLGNSKKLNGILRIFLVWIRLILANIKIIAQLTLDAFRAFSPFIITVMLSSIQ